MDGDAPGRVGGADHQSAVDHGGAAVGAEGRVDGGGQGANGGRPERGEVEVEQRRGNRPVAVEHGDAYAAGCGKGFSHGDLTRARQAVGGGKADAAVVNVVVLVANLSGDRFDLGREVVEGAVADVDETLETAREYAVGDGGAGAARGELHAGADALAGQRADPEDGDRAEHRGGADHGGGRVVELARLDVDQRQPAGGKHGQRAIVAFEGGDGDVLGEPGDFAVALVLEAGGRDVARPGPGDLGIEGVDGAQPAIDRVDRDLDLLVGLGAQLLHVGGQRADTARHGGAGGDHAKAQRRVLGIDRQGVEGDAQLGEIGRQGGVAARRPKARLNLGEELGGCPGGAEHRGLALQLADQEIVDHALDAADRHAAADTRDDPRLEPDDLPRIADGVRIGDVLRHHGHRRLGDAESAEAVLQDRGDRHGAAPQILSSRAIAVGVAGVTVGVGLPAAV